MEAAKYELTDRNGRLVLLMSVLDAVLSNDGTQTLTQIIEGLKDLYLSKKNADTASGLIEFASGLSIDGKRISYINKNSDEELTEDDESVMTSLKILNTLLRKDKADSTNFLMGFLGGILTNSIKSTDLSEGTGGAGWEILNKNGKSYLEVDELLVRMKATLTELELRKLSYMGGNVLLSCAGSVITKVETASNGTDYLVHFKNDDGTTQTRNWWAVNDLARCQTLNKSTDATGTTLANRYYWRKVTWVGTDSICLSATDCDASGTDTPAVGDTIVQLGNSSDTTRQGAIMMTTYDTNSPAIIEYNGISDYSLSGKAKTIISPTGGNTFTGDFRLNDGTSIFDVIDGSINSIVNGSTLPRNYYLKSKTGASAEYGNTTDTAVTSSLSNGWKALIGKTITISFQLDYDFLSVKDTRNNRAGVSILFKRGTANYYAEAFYDFNKAKDISDSFNYSTTIEIPDDVTAIDTVGSYVQVDASAYITNIKVEIGSTKSDWTAAPEDTINSLSTEVSQNASSISAVVKGLTNTGINIKDGEIDLFADKTKVKMSDGTLIAMFADGKLSASLIDVVTLAAQHVMCYDGSTLRASLNRNNDGVLKYYYDNGQVMKEEQFSYGADGKSVESVQTVYYNYDGTVKWITDCNGTTSSKIKYNWQQGKFHVIEGTLSEETLDSTYRNTNTLTAPTWLSKFINSGGTDTTHITLNSVYDKHLAVGQVGPNADPSQGVDPDNMQTIVWLTGYVLADLKPEVNTDGSYTRHFLHYSSGARDTSGDITDNYTV